MGSYCFLPPRMGACSVRSMNGNVPAMGRRRVSELPRPSVGTPKVAAPVWRRSVHGSSGIGPFLVLPALILMAVFLYRPILRGVQLSLYRSDLLGEPTRFVGLENYASLFTDPDQLRVLTTSLLIAALAMTMSVGAAYLVVLLLRDRLPSAGVFRTLFSLPFAYSAASATAIFAGLLAPSVGTLNAVLAHLGVDGPPWLQSTGWAVFSIALTTAWYEFGFAFLVLAAAMKDVPPEVVEAAELDGAAGPRLAWSILTPLVSPSLFFLVVTQTITGLQTFTQVHVLTRGGPSGSTTTVVYELYLRAFGSGVPDFGRASTIAVFLLVVVVLITALQFRLLNKKVTTA